MKYQILFSWKNKKNISKCCLLKFLPSMQSVILTDTDFRNKTYLREGSSLNSFISAHDRIKNFSFCATLGCAWKLKREMKGTINLYHSLGNFQQTTNWWYFSYFSQKKGFDISCNLHILRKKLETYFKMSSAENFTQHIKRQTFFF